MQRFVSTLIFSFLIFPFCCPFLAADGAAVEQKEITQKLFEKEDSFTGKILKDRVRLRASPAADGPVVKELSRGNMLVVIGEVDDFYMVKPSKDVKTYIYRPFVLDGVVEGKHVNVRLSPNTDAPVLTQLNTGDRVEGKLCEQNTKWLEIAPPAAVVFYVSRDFVEKVGDANFLAVHEARKENVNRLLSSTYLLAEGELKKPFNEMHLQKVVDNYQHIIADYSDFPEQQQRATQRLAEFNEACLHKKVAYLESKDMKEAFRSESAYSGSRHAELASSQAFQKGVPDASKIYEQWIQDEHVSDMDSKMALWIPVEVAYYEEWAKDNEHRPIHDFYEEQRGQSVLLRGVVQAYDRAVRNKPGDYLLVSKTNHFPIAYVYSTHINLKDKLGKEITVRAVLRPNNNFAYPAYFVMDVESAGDA